MREMHEQQKQSSPRVKSRTSKGRAEQAERRRAEQAAHQRAEEASRAVREQQRTTSERHISRNWEPER